MLNPERMLPNVTVWIAARNEEDNILHSLSAMNALSYPKEQLQILIGNDQSDDKTRELVLDFIKDKPHFQLVDIEKTINNQRGKANVLANLYEHSTGKYFLISDADVKVNPDWIHGMIRNFEQDARIGHQVGVTALNVGSMFHAFQSIDWLYALSLLKKAADLKIPLTGLGNNSAVSRAAYEATGGYAKMPFSITEDFALFHETIKKGFGFRNTINLQVFAKTQPIFSMKEFLHQRKRWMVGALQCPWWIVLLLYLNALFLPILTAIGIFFSWKLAALIWLIKWIIQTLNVLPVILKLKQFSLVKHLFFYEFYSNWWGLTMVLFYYLPVKVDWKGRIYE